MGEIAGRPTELRRGLVPPAYSAAVSSSLPSRLPKMAGECFVGGGRSLFNIARASESVKESTQTVNERGCALGQRFTVDDPEVLQGAAI